MKYLEKQSILEWWYKLDMIRKETAASLVTQMLIVSESDWTTFSDRCLTNNVEQTFVLKIQSFNHDPGFGFGLATKPEIPFKLANDFNNDFLNSIYLGTYLEIPFQRHLWYQ